MIHDSTAAADGARLEWPLRGIAADLGPAVIDLPAAVLVGDRDRVEPAAVLQDLLLPELGGTTDLDIVAGAGHLLPLEAPDHVAAVVAGFHDRFGR